MPTRSDLEFATPLCYARTMERNGQHGVHHTCFKPMKYSAALNLWRCPAGHSDVAGEFVTHRLEYTTA